MHTDAGGIPLVTSVTGANRHDVTQLLPLVDAVPAVAGRHGRPRRRPQRVQGDRAYDSQPHRRELRRRGIQPVLAKRRTAHGSGWGVIVGWSNGPTIGCINFVASASVTNAVPTFTKPS